MSKQIQTVPCKVVTQVQLWVESAPALTAGLKRRHTAEPQVPNPDRLEGSNTHWEARVEITPSGSLPVESKYKLNREWSERVAPKPAIKGRMW